MNVKIIIPARKGSKGLPFKNRKLLDYTINNIPNELYRDVYITTDDEEIMKRVSRKGLNLIERKKELAQDITSTKDVMIDAVHQLNLSPQEVVIMLYLTYPQRSWNQVEAALNFYNQHNAKSLLCKKKLEVSPYMCMFKNGIKGKQIIKHNLYRRQEYPDCFEISWIISIFQASELGVLNNNLYNDDTVFFNIDNFIDDVIDVDTEEDFKKITRKGLVNES